MWCRNHILEMQQRIVLARWFLVEHIQACPGDAAAGERLEQCGFVMDGSARSGDEECGWLHHRKLPAADQPLGLASQRAGHLDEVGALEEFGKRNDSHPRARALASSR